MTAHWGVLLPLLSADADTKVEFADRRTRLSCCSLRQQQQQRYGCDYLCVQCTRSPPPRHLCLAFTRMLPLPCLALPVPRSALHDGRFSPIEASELRSLDVSVSLLVKYEQARHWEDWEVRCVALRCGICFTARVDDHCQFCELKMPIFVRPYCRKP